MSVSSLTHLLHDPGAAPDFLAPAALAAARLQERMGPPPRSAVVLGSGLGALVAEEEQRLCYDEVGLPSPGVHGHAGALCRVRLGTEAVLMLQGRIHPYERRSAEESVRAVRALAIWGVERLLLTTAVGSLHPDVGPGALWQVVDHLNLTGMNPLAGAEPPAPWTRFVDLGGAYDGPMGEVLVAAAAARSVPLRRGVYGAMPGPSYESPAEIRMLRRMDADVVGMSLVHEVIAARQIGLRTAALAVISNLAAGLSLEVLAHEDVTRAMALAVPALRGVIEEAVARW